LGILWPHSNAIAFNNAGMRAPGAKAYFFEAGTTTPRTTYSDAALTTPHTHPVLADGNGRFPAIFLDYGAYRERVRTSGETTIWDTDNIPNAAPTDPGAGVDANSIFQTGDYLFVGKNGTRDGFVRCNGRTIGSATSGATERANADCEDLFTYIYNAYANGQAAVSGGRGANAAADWAANKTIALPDHRSAAMIGFDDMGNSFSGLTATTPVVSGANNVAGSIIGSTTHTLSTGELSPHTHGVSLTSDAQGAHDHTWGGSTSSDGAHTHTGTTTSDGDHSHTYQLPDIQAFVAGGATGARNTNATTTATSTNGAHSHTFTTSSSGAHGHTVGGTTSSNGSHQHISSGTTGAAGSGSAHNNVQRSIPVTVLMKL
jgi:hypothetical protein